MNFFLTLFSEKLQQSLFFLKTSSSNFSKKYPEITQIIQFTFIYLFAIIDLLYTILNNLFSLGAIPEIILISFPLIKAIFNSPILKILSSPEKVFILSFVVIELMVVRPIFKFSKLVKYNILLVFSLLMLQGLVMSYWDFFVHKDIAIAAAKIISEQGVSISTNTNFALFLFFITFIIFLMIYLYLYLQALQGKFGLIKNMEWVTDSVAFWLRIKTPTMGKKGDKKEN